MRSQLLLLLLLLLLHMHQLCSTLCHMCAVMTAEQAEALSPLSLPRTISRSMAEFLQVSQSKEEPAKEGMFHHCT